MAKRSNITRTRATRRAAPPPFSEKLRKPWGPARETDELGGTPVTFDKGPDVHSRVADVPRGRLEMAELTQTLNEAHATTQALCRELVSLRARVADLEAEPYPDDNGVSASGDLTPTDLEGPTPDGPEEDSP